MKRVRNVVLSVVVVGLIGLSSFVFAGCGCNNTNQNVTDLPRYIEEWYSGGLLIAGEEGQLFARYSVSNDDTKESFQGKIEVEDDELDVYMDTQDTIKRNYFNFYASPKTNQTGRYKYKITIYSMNELYEIDGEINIGGSFKGVDKLQGGANRSRTLNGFSTENYTLLHTTNIGKQSISNIASFGDNIIAGDVNGSLYIVSRAGEIQSENQTSKNAIEFIQTLDNYIITVSVDGEIQTFELNTNVNTTELKQLSSTKSGARLSGLPTLVDRDSMIACTVDGYIRMLDLPNLNTVWEYQAKGSINGGACLLQAETNDGIKSVIIASSDDRGTYYLNENGDLLNKEMGNEQLVSCTPAAKNTKITFSTSNNQVYARTPSGLRIWDNQTNYEIVSGPAFNGKLVAASSEKKVQIFDIEDGYEQVSINLEDSISGELFFIEDNICVPIVSGQIAIFDGYLGNPVGKLHFAGELKYTPLVLDDNTLVGFNDKSQIFFWGIAQKAQNVGELDPKSVVYPGGRGGPKHTNFVNTDLPIHQRRLLAIQGKFAPAIVSNKYLFLYNIDEERFSCNLRSSGAEVWGLKAKAPFEEQFFGAGVDLGYHNSPIYYTPDGLILSTVDGLLQVDPITGNEIKRAQITGFCNADESIILVANPETLYCLDKNTFREIWKVDGSFFAESVCIEGNTVYAVDRREGNAKILIIEKKTGRITFSIDDESLAFATKLVVTDKYVGFGSLGGVWLFHKNPPSIVGAVYGTSRSANLMVRDNDIITTNQIGDIMKFDVNSYQDVPIQPPSSPDTKINWMYFDGNEILTNNALVQIAKYLPDLPEGQKATEAQNQEIIRNTHIMIRNPETGKPMFTELIDSNGASEFSLTIGTDAVAVCVHNGPEPKFILFGE